MATSPARSMRFAPKPPNAPPSGAPREHVPKRPINGQQAEADRADWDNAYNGTAQLRSQLNDQTGAPTTPILGGSAVLTGPVTATGQSVLQALGLAIIKVAADYTFRPSDFCVFAFDAGFAFTVTLPPPTIGRLAAIKNCASRVLTVQTTRGTTPAQYVDAVPGGPSPASSFTLGQLDGKLLMADGSTWWVISDFTGGSLGPAGTSGTDVVETEGAEIGGS